MKKKSTTKELGIYKNKIHAALYKNQNIREILLGDTTQGMSASQILKEFKKHVKSHLFIDDTITETDTFIYYDVVADTYGTSTKNCKIIVYAICHRDILDGTFEKEGYYGNRSDILVQMIEESLLDESVINDFGIGELDIDSVGLYNATRFYGHIITFEVPNFR